MPDSDQSISDEEELAHHDCVSLAASLGKKQGSEILSRLELLQEETHRNVNEACGLSDSKRGIPVVEEDDVEMPDFYDEDELVRLPRKLVSEAELSKISSSGRGKKISEDGMLGLGAEKQEISHSWSSFTKEAEALVHLREHGLFHSKQKKVSKGVKGKGKPKLSFRFQSHKEGLSSRFSPRDENSLAISEDPVRRDAIEPRTELPEDILEEEENLQEVVRCGGVEQSKSMVELFDSLPKPASIARGGSKMKNSVGGKRYQLGDRNVNEEVFPDIRDSSEPSSDSEMSDKEIDFAIRDLGRKTIVDQFEEAFGDALLNEERKSPHSVSKAQRTGLFSRLQQVMLIEKERETDFLQKIAFETDQSIEPSCIYVRILSKRLEAKLTVCYCTVGDNLETLQSLEPINELYDKRSNKTIIFNQRVSVNVDLETGNYIRIRPPWKEVRVSNDKSIILATYFSNFRLRSSGHPFEA